MALHRQGRVRHHHRRHRQHLLQFSALQFASVLGVLIFARLTAYTQRIKDGYYELMSDGSALAKGFHHGRAQPLSRLHQHVHLDALVVRQPQV
jgi:hypothetical protein